MKRQKVYGKNGEKHSCQFTYVIKYLENLSK